MIPVIGGTTKVPNKFTAILVYAEHHANALAKQFPTLVKILKYTTPTAASAGVAYWMFTHPRNDEKTLSDAKAHLDYKGHTHDTV
jgi:hypothetical protein